MNFVVNQNITDLRIVFSISATYESSKPAKGFAVNYFKINKPPSSGKCSLDKYNGTAFVTYFTITCSGWQDLDGIIEKYEFYGKSFKYFYTFN